MPSKEDFPPIFNKLRGILQKLESRLAVKADTAAGYHLDAAFSEKFKREIFFGSVQIKKNSYLQTANVHEFIRASK